MSQPQWHWLEAIAPLGRWCAAIEAGILTGSKAAAQRLPLPPIDVVVQHVPGGAVPELGMGGFSQRPNCFAIAIDTATQSFATALAAGALPRWAGSSPRLHLIGRYLAAHPEARPSTLAGIHAARLLTEAC